MKLGTLTHQGTPWIPRAERATALFDRLRGLLGRDALGPGAALLIDHCGDIHTLGMRFPIDVIFLDRAWRVIRIVRDVPPGRITVWGGWRARRVLETEAGRVDLAALKPGDTLEWSERVSD